MCGHHHQIAYNRFPGVGGGGDGGVGLGKLLRKRAIPLSPGHCSIANQWAYASVMATCVLTCNAQHESSLSEQSAVDAPLRKHLHANFSGYPYIHGMHQLDAAQSLTHVLKKNLGCFWINHAA